MMWNSKKGVSVWISYILLTALVVSLGFLVLTFTRETTQRTVDDIVERGETLSLCEISGVDVQNLCQNTQTLNMDVTNTNDIKVVGLWARMFDIYGNPQVSSRNITIAPQKSKSISIIKQAIVGKVEIIPVVQGDNKLVKCQSRSISFDPVTVCS